MVLVGMSGLVRADPGVWSFPIDDESGCLVAP
jgi:hypothetical protein